MNAVPELAECVPKVFSLTCFGCCLAAHLVLIVCIQGLIIASVECPTMNKHMSRRWLEANRGMEF